MSDAPNPREVIERAVTGLPPQDRARYAEELMQYAAAALVFVAGNQEATERAYRMADKMATLK